MVKVDAIGQVCPVPIIMTKNALKDIEEGQVEVSVDKKIYRRCQKRWGMTTQ